MFVFHSGHLRLMLLTAFSCCKVVHCSEIHINKCSSSDVENGTFK